MNIQIANQLTRVQNYIKEQYNPVSEPSYSSSIPTAIPAYGVPTSNTPSFSFSNIGNTYGFNNNNQTTVTGSRSQEERDEDRNLTIFIVGTVVTLAASFVLGFTLKEYNATKATLTQFQNDFDEIFPGKNNLIEQPNYADICAAQKILKEHLEIELHKTNKAFTYMMTNIGLIAGAAMLILGSFGIAAPVLVPVGSVLVIASLAVTLFTYAYCWNDSSDLKSSYSKLQSRILELLPKLPAT